MHIKCPECNLEFTPEELHDASLEDHLEYKRVTNDLIKNLRAENARYRKALEFYKDQTNFSVYCYEVNPKTFGDDELGSHAREALRGE